MNSINLIGNITNDLELKQGNSNGYDWSLLNFNIAINKWQKNKEDKAIFIKCVAGGKTAEIIAKYFKKGSKIALTGGAIVTGKQIGRAHV